MTTVRPESRLQQSLDDVTRVLDRHRVLETLTHRQEGPKRDLLESLQHRQNRRILSKELLVSLLNGSIWGVVVGIVAVALYAKFALGAVMNRCGGAQPRRRGRGRSSHSIWTTLDRARSGVRIERIAYVHH
jgi:hypothetical protein